MATTDFLSPNHHPADLADSHLVRRHIASHRFLSPTDKFVMSLFLPQSPYRSQKDSISFHLQPNMSKISGSHSRHSSSVLSSAPALQVPTARAGAISRATLSPTAPKICTSCSITRCSCKPQSPDSSDPTCLLENHTVRAVNILLAICLVIKQ